MAPLPTRTSRVPALIAGFSRYLDAYTRKPAFTRAGQLEYHLESIALRRQLGSATAAVSDEAFVRSLYRTLQAWGIGSRASSLVPQSEFAAPLPDKKTELAAPGAPGGGGP